MSVTVSETSSSLQLLQKEVFTAYLQPLLKKHHETTQEEFITYEDLIDSLQAATEILGKMTADASYKTTVREKLVAMHQGQLKAYREAAGQALLQWADAVQLAAEAASFPTVSDYQKTCRDHAEKCIPAWRNVTRQVQIAYNRLDERAAEHYNNLKLESKAVENTVDDVEVGDDEEEEEGEIDEEDDGDGAIDEVEEEDVAEDGEVVSKQSSSVIKTKKSKTTATPTKIPKSGTPVKKKTITKASVGNKKGTLTAASRGRRGRGRGRGGIVK